METIYLRGRSAYEYWHGLRLDSAARLDERVVVPREAPWLDMRPVRVAGVASRALSDEQIRGLLAHELRGYHLPLEVLVDSPGARGVSALKACRVWSGPLANGSFVRVGSRIYVSTPEFLTLQMARELPLVELLTFIYELCGFYARAHWGQEGAVRCRSLMSLRSLSAYVGRMADAPGVKPLRRALRFAAEGSASPMETAMVLLLCLPRKLGGYGLPLPEMNGRVDVPPALRGALGTSYLFCDAYWRKARFAVEYDGRLYHEGSDRVHRDYARANALRALGVGAETLTIAEVGNSSLFDAAARRIARALGVKLRGLDGEWLARRRNLRSQLLDPCGKDDLAYACGYGPHADVW